MLEHVINYVTGYGGGGRGISVWMSTCNVSWFPVKYYTLEGGVVPHKYVAQGTRLSVSQVHLKSCSLFTLLSNISCVLLQNFTGNTNA